MRILITGVTGQIGRALVRRLQSSATVMAADRTVLDLGRPETITAVLNGLAPDVVINSAAYTSVDTAEAERELAMLANAEAPEVMARWASVRGVPFIHFSTDYVFDGSGEAAWREDDTTHPLSAYGISKLEGEARIRAAAGNSLIVRTQWVYSTEGQNFFCSIVRAAVQHKKLRVVADQFGAPTPAALIADVMTNIVSGGPDQIRKNCERSAGILHLACLGETSWCGFATAILDELRAHGITIAAERVVPITTAEYPTAAKRPLNCRLNVSRLQSVFEVTPARWDVALRAEVDGFARRVRDGTE